MKKVYLLRSTTVKKLSREFAPLLRSRNAQAALMMLKPGGSSSESVENEHPQAEQWLFVISGSGQVTVGKRRIRLWQHILLLIERKEKHRITNTGRTNLVTLNWYCPAAYTRDGRVLTRAARGTSR